MKKNILLWIFLTFSFCLFDSIYTSETPENDPDSVDNELRLLLAQLNLDYSSLENVFERRYVMEVIVQDTITYLILASNLMKLNEPGLTPNNDIITALVREFFILNTARPRSQFISESRVKELLELAAPVSHSALLRELKFAIENGILNFYKLLSTKFEEFCTCLEMCAYVLNLVSLIDNEAYPRALVEVIVALVPEYIRLSRIAMTKYESSDLQRIKKQLLNLKKSSSELQVTTFDSLNDEEDDPEEESKISMMRKYMLHLSGHPSSLTDEEAAVAKEIYSRYFDFDASFEDVLYYEMLLRELISFIYYLSSNSIQFDIHTSHALAVATLDFGRKIESALKVKHSYVSTEDISSARMRAFKTLKMSELHAFSIGALSIKKTVCKKELLDSCKAIYRRLVDVFVLLNGLKDELLKLTHIRDLWNDVLNFFDSVIKQVLANIKKIQSMPESQAMLHSFINLGEKSSEDYKRSVIQELTVKLNSEEFSRLYGPNEKVKRKKKKKSKSDLSSRYPEATQEQLQKLEKQIEEPVKEKITKEARSKARKKEERLSKLCKEDYLSEKKEEIRKTILQQKSESASNKKRKQMERKEKSRILKEKLEKERLEESERAAELKSRKESMHKEANQRYSLDLMLTALEGLEKEIQKKSCSNLLSQVSLVRVAVQENISHFEKDESGKQGGGSVEGATGGHESSVSRTGSRTPLKKGVTKRKADEELRTPSVPTMSLFSKDARFASSSRVPRSRRSRSKSRSRSRSRSRSKSRSRGICNRNFG
ncbi:hypothetical protein HWI79_2893 [Cryptosporidium felis]|nr:hypothetical protein HWI79_2893 [Cryptosporidium felis]